MTLNAQIIRQKLDQAPSNQKDNVAQDLINSATSTELKGLEVEGVLRLYTALAWMTPRLYSFRDAAAMKRLSTYTRFQPVTDTPRYGVELIKRERKNHPLIQSQLSPELVNRIYVAEGGRLSTLERLGIDGDTIGRGQLGQGAYTDVKEPKHFASAFETCATRVFIAKALSHPTVNTGLIDFKHYKIMIPSEYKRVKPYPALEDFVVAAYLAIRIQAATKTGRSALDTTRFAVAIYHGMYNMVVTAQNTVKDKINWAPVEAELINQGHTDQVAYVNEVAR